MASSSYRYGYECFHTWQATLKLLMIWYRFKKFTDCLKKKGTKMLEVHLNWTVQAPQISTGLGSAKSLIRHNFRYATDFSPRIIAWNCSYFIHKMLFRVTLGSWKTATTDRFLHETCPGRDPGVEMRGGVIVSPNDVRERVRGGCRVQERHPSLSSCSVQVLCSVRTGLKRRHFLKRS